MKALEFIDAWIFKAYEPCTRSLPLFRILFSLYLLIFCLPRYAWLSEMPNSFFYPPVSLALFFSKLPPGWFFYALDFLLVSGALCLLFGLHTRFVSFALCSGLIIGNSFSYSIGTKIDHDILTPATLFCLGFSGWGNRFSRDELSLSPSTRRSSSSWPISLLTLMIGVCMFTAALPKALTGWLSPHVLASRGHLIQNYVENGRPMPLTDLLVQIHSTLFWKFGDWSTIAIEGGFLFCMFSLPAMRLLATFATFFHVFVYLSMGIFFASNFVAYACLVDWRIILRKLWIRRKMRQFHWMANRVSLPHVVILAALLTGFSYCMNYYEINFQFLRENVCILMAFIVALMSLLYFVGALKARLLGPGISPQAEVLSRDSVQGVPK